MERRKTVVVRLNMGPGNDRNENVRQEPHRSCEATPRAWAVSSSGAKNRSEGAGAAGSTRWRSACSSQQRACLLAVQRCARSESWEELQGVLPLDPGQIAWVQERVVQQGLDQALDIRLRRPGSRCRADRGYGYRLGGRRRNRRATRRDTYRWLQRGLKWPGVCRVECMRALASHKAQDWREGRRLRARELNEQGCRSDGLPKRWA